MNKQHTSNEVFDRLKLRLNISSDAKLAEWFEVTPQSVSLNRRRNTIPETWKTIINTKLGISIDSLLATDESPENKQPDVFFVPLVAARISAGHGSFEVEDTEVNSYAFRYDWLRRKGNPNSMVLMRVSGDSMEPKLMNNDLVLVDQSRNDIIPLQIYAVGVDECIYVKQLRPLPRRHLQLYSLNEAYPPMDVDMNEDLADTVRIIGKVIWSCHEM